MARGRQTARERLKAKLAKKNQDTAGNKKSEFNNNLKNLLQIEEGSLFRSRAKKIIKIYNKLDIVAREDLKLLEDVFDRYVLSITPKFITISDIKTLSICFNKVTLMEENLSVAVKGLVRDPEKFLKLINKVKDLISCLGLKDKGGVPRDFQYHEDILIYNENNFPFEKRSAEETQELIKNYIRSDFYRAAFSLYESNKKDFSDNNSAVLSEIFIFACMKSMEEKSMDCLEKVIKKFKINLNTLVIEFEKVLFTPMSFISAQQSFMKEPYIKLLVKLGMHPDDAINRSDFDRFLKFTPLMINCSRNDVESVELLIKYGADINLETVFTNKMGRKLTYRTPFSMSISAKNLDLIKYLLSNGANPLKAGVLTKELYQKMGFNFSEDINFFPVLSPNKKMSVEEDGEYLYKVFDLIEEYYTNRILLSIESEGVRQEDSKHVGTDKELKANELLENYITFKKIPLVQKKEIDNLGELSLESKFDLLVLEFLKKYSDVNRKKIFDFIEQNPELNLYDSTQIFKSKDGDEANKAVSNKKLLIKQFFEIKKGRALYGNNNESIDDLEGAFVVKSSGLKNKIYIAVHPELKKDESYQRIEEKINNELLDTKFVSSKSYNINGIKSYDGIIKLKFCKKNLYLYTNYKYYEESTGNVLIVFDKIGDHKKVDRDASNNKKLSVEKIDSLQSFWSQINVDNNVQEPNSLEDNLEEILFLNEEFPIVIDGSDKFEQIMESARFDQVFNTDLGLD